jgi:hypothetical protein
MNFIFGYISCFFDEKSVGDIWLYQTIHKEIEDLIVMTTDIPKLHYQKKKLKPVL